MNKNQKVKDEPSKLKKWFPFWYNQVNEFDDVYVIIHHTVGWTLASINKSHKLRFYDNQKNKQPIWKVNWKITDFPYIAYHYIVTRNWDIYQNRWHDQIWYHASNWYVNNRSIAISFDWNYENQELTVVQKEALQKILNKIKNEYKKEIKVYGHRDVWNDYTACPWKNIYKLMNEINNMANNWNNKTSYYKEIFEKEYNWQSTVYKNIELAKEQLQIDTVEKENWFYFLLIWLERAKNNQ